MTPTDPTPAAPRPSPEDEALLLDGLRGELSPRAQRALEARLAHEPGLAAASERLATFLAAARSAHEPLPDAAVARRIALRVRDQATAEEARARREALSPPARRRLAWGRVLALSATVHVILLGAIAWGVHREAQEEPEASLHAVLPLPGLPEQGDVLPEIPEAWSGRDAVVRVPDEGDLVGLAGPAAEDEDLAPLYRDLRDHPRPVALEMVIRRREDLKRHRLERYGLDAGRTLRKVQAGLRALENDQRRDGSFPAGGGRSATGQTALALLPFLADGDSSRTGSDARGREVVLRGVAWLRGVLFERERGTLLPPRIPVAEMGMALRALSEDYMLSYGHLAPGEATRRAIELSALAAHIAGTQAEDGSFPGSSEDVRAAVWPMWGLEAAVRTGAVAVADDVPERFRRFYARSDAADPMVAAAGLLLARGLGDAFRDEAPRRVATVLAEGPAVTADPFLATAAGTGLLLNDGDAFRAWNATLGERLLEGLLPTGRVGRGDPVGDTALHLLAVQAAYRTY